MKRCNRPPFALAALQRAWPSDHMNRLIADNCAPSAPKRTEMCPNPAFDGPVILFENIIEVLHRSMSTVLLQNTGGFEFNDGGRVNGMLVGVDDLMTSGTG